MPELSSSSKKMVFNIGTGSVYPAVQKIKIDNMGQGSLSWTAVCAAPWLSVEPAHGVAGDVMSVRVDAIDLDGGEHHSQIEVRDSDNAKSPQIISIELNIIDGVKSHCNCKPLPKSPGKTVIVAKARALEDAVYDANNNGGHTTILMLPGIYHLWDSLTITAPAISIRGINGDRDSVVLKGDGMNGGVSHIFLVRSDHFTVADLTFGWVANHGIQVQGEHDADDLLIHNVRIVDTNEQLLKVSYDQNSLVGADRGIVECSLFEYTAGVGPQYYIGGIDGHYCHDWIVRHNVFKYIRSPEKKLAEYAIHFWSNSSGSLIEGNQIIDCDRGIGLGMGSSGHVGGTIINNMVHTTRDVGISMETTLNAKVTHNTVYSANYANSIEYRWPETTGVDIVNNLTTGKITQRNSASAEVWSNAKASPVDFIDANGGDLHLVRALNAAMRKGDPENRAEKDFDCELRSDIDRGDIGADVYMQSK